MTPKQIDKTDRAIVVAAQAGLPLVPRPYHALAETVGCSEKDLIGRIERMMQDGIIRRIGIVPNQYALGLTHNAMTVWDIADEDITRLGRDVGTLEFVSHCYHRPRRLPAWPYNLFAMVHGTTRDEVVAKTQEVERILGASCRGRDVLVSTRILKKTGLRLTA